MSLMAISNKSSVRDQGSTFSSTFWSSEIFVIIQFPSLIW